MTPRSHDDHAGTRFIGRVENLIHGVTGFHHDLLHDKGAIQVSFLSVFTEAPEPILNDIRRMPGVVFSKGGQILFPHGVFHQGPGEFRGLFDDMDDDDLCIQPIGQQYGVPGGVTRL